MATDLTIVTEIRRQIISGGAIKVMSWGTNSYAALDKYTLRFKVQGRLHKGFVTVALTVMDDYNVKLLDELGKTVKTVQHVYCDNLTDVIDGMVERVPLYKR